jgi:hypothetical protein
MTRSSRAPPSLAPVVRGRLLKNTRPIFDRWYWSVIIAGSRRQLRTSSMAYKISRVSGTQIALSADCLSASASVFFGAKSATFSLRVMQTLRSESDT